MSIESAKAFIERLKTDEEFSAKVRECQNPEARRAFVMKAGFDFTAEEIKNVGETQLSDGELDEVAGGREDADNAFCYAFYY